jgi:long-chain acyl-CoA synthetase
LRTPRRRVVVIVGRARCPCARGARAHRRVACVARVDADRLDPPEAPPPHLAYRDPARAAMLMYTSGTTGLPKGVLLSHANMLHAGRTVASHHGLSDRDRVLSSLPLYHINGQCISTVGTLCAGGSVVMPHRFSCRNGGRRRAGGRLAQPRPDDRRLPPERARSAGRRGRCAVRFARSASAPLPQENGSARSGALRDAIVRRWDAESASIAFTTTIARERQRLGSQACRSASGRVVDRRPRAGRWPTRRNPDPRA